MSIWSLSKTAASNSTMEGIAVGEGVTQRDQMNDLFRALGAAWAKWRDDTGGQLTTAGGTVAYTLTTNGTLAALADGVELAFVCNTTNTGASTLNVDTRGAKKIRKITGEGEVALRAGDMVAAGHYTVRYDASADSAAGAWILLNPANRGSIQTVNVDVSAVDFTVPTGAKFLRFRLSNVAPASAGSLNMRFNAGSGFEVGASDYTREHRQQIGGSGTNITGLGSSISLVPDVAATAARGVTGEVLVNPGDTGARALATITGMMAVTGTGMSFVQGGGERVTNGLITEVRFFFGSGNIDSGTFTMDVEF